MDTFSRVQLLANSIQFNRRAGHSYAMVNGAANSDCMVITNNSLSEYPEIKKERKVSLSNLNRLRGNRKPIVFDNSAITDLFCMVLIEFGQLKEENERLNKVVERIKATVQ